MCQKLVFVKFLKIVFSYVVNLIILIEKFSPQPKNENHSEIDIFYNV